MKLCHLFEIKKMTEFPDAPIAAKRTPYQTNQLITLLQSHEHINILYSFFSNALNRGISYQRT